jgi:hypothetical protein
MTNIPWYQAKLLDSVIVKKIFICFIYIVTILVSVIVYVSLTSCRRNQEFTEKFDVVPDFQTVTECATKLDTSVSEIYKRVCVLDGFVGTGVAANFETTLNIKVGLLSKDEFEAGRPERIKQATTQMLVQRTTQLGNDCTGKPVVTECFEDLADWKLLEKNIRKSLQRLRIASITLFKWISPNTRGFAKTAAIEGFASQSTALQTFMDTCLLTSQNQKADDIPDTVKVGLWSLILQSEAYLPEIKKELTFLETIQQKLKAKKERLENGELTDDDLALGSSTTGGLVQPS